MKPSPAPNGVYIIAYIIIKLCHFKCAIQNFCCIHSDMQPLKLFLKFYYDKEILH